MKIIDLLNKIANGEDKPKKIKYDGRLYEFNDKKDNYYENETCSINWDYVTMYCLNDEVEILEEKKIPEKLYDIVNLKEGICKAPSNEQLMHKINEIINYLKSKGE